ncbi:MAG: DUF3108 domain-containing protein [Pseudoxanthomonas suwonensis]|nr:DUF3108 domain-containing protein [Pseudoxanthomonas suwonensis]
MILRRLTFTTALLAGMALAPAAAVEPFNADYSATYMGMSANAQMSIAAAGNNRWTYSMRVNNRMGSVSQSTTFDVVDGKLRPLSGTDTSQVLIRRRSTNSTYDWNAGQARWSGDVKANRSGPIALRSGDLDALLMNLAIARDVPAGRNLSYRMVENGRARQMNWQSHGREAVTVGGKSHQATRVSQTDGDKQMVLWVVEGIPVPVRILQKRDGKDEIDLRMTALR